ncbi:MAG: FemAB family PEP-CTERM system-associated protein [Planctomycetes bacterium]|nr:FemAB family PEP-CTERM system-associated protein [Planctomycetota bacterium]
MTAATESAKTGTLVVRAFASDDREAWDAFVRRHDRGTFFHLVGWKDAVERVFGHESKYVVAERDGALVGAMPLFLVRSPFTGTNLVSVPYAVYGGPLATDSTALEGLLEHAKREAHDNRVGCLELRYLEAPSEDDGVPSELYTTFIRELCDSPDDTLSLLPKKARAAARQGLERHGLELAAGAWYLDDLHGLFHANKRSLGSPGLPLAWFQALLEAFEDDCVVHVVRKDWRPVAAVMSFRFGDQFLPYYSGKTPEANAWNVDNFLYWQLMTDAVRRGHRVFDFGRSRRDTGAYQFKKNQGFEPRELGYRYHLVKRKHVPKFNPSNPKLNLPRRAWSKLPMFVSKRLGGWLSRYLP